MRNLLHIEYNISLFSTDDIVLIFEERFTILCINSKQYILNLIKNN